MTLSRAPRPCHACSPVDGLLSAEEESWKFQRKLVEPGFRYAYLKTVVVPVVDRLAVKLVRVCFLLVPGRGKLCGQLTLVSAQLCVTWDWADAHV